MERNLYLTKALKDYYLLDFQELLDYKDSDFWDIDEGINEFLTLINSNPNIQTLYSKKFVYNNDAIALETASYLELTFTKPIESKLRTLLAEIKTTLTSTNSVVTINKIEPCDNANYNPESRILLGCITDRDYFRIKHVHIEIDSIEPKDHDLFWNTLASKLPLLSE